MLPEFQCFVESAFAHEARVLVRDGALEVFKWNGRNSWPNACLGGHNFIPDFIIAVKSATYPKRYRKSIYSTSFSNGCKSKKS